MDTEISRPNPVKVHSVYCI